MLLGMTLQTRPEEIYRALIESTAYGTRVIIENFHNNGVPINKLLAGGGLTKNPLLIQIYADVTEYEIRIPDSPEIAALGAAMLAAVAAGVERGGYSTLSLAAQNMAPKEGCLYIPNPQSSMVYRQIFQAYSQLVNYFGHYENPVMDTLRKLRNAAK